MGEPRLEDIEDYNTLKGQKRKVVFAVIIVGLLMSIVYGVAVSFTSVEEPSSVDKTYRTVPMR